jgi:predicted AlkP superfamily pyrophosphatase or phosphodiesterase
VRIIGAELATGREDGVSKVVLVLSDALRDDVAAQRMGYLEHLVEAKRGTRFTVTAELPTLSRPLYETIHTGLRVSDHGIVSNHTVRMSNVPNVFDASCKGGLMTAAAAYYWFSELYVRAPYDRVDDREIDRSSAGIQHGRFYTEDSYPDAELFAAAAMLVRRFQPDYLLVHPMGMDYLGETFGADSDRYRNNATYQDMALAELVPEWLEGGYTVLVTGDHGINADHTHGGTTPDVRDVPLYILPADRRGQGYTRRTVSQLAVAPTLCRLLGVPVPETMRERPLV